MKTYSKNSIDTLSDVFAAWMGGEPESTAETKEFLQKSRLDKLMFADDVENVIFRSGYFAPELVPTVYALVPPELQLKNGKRKALFAQVFYRMNLRASKQPGSRLVNMDYTRAMAVYREYGAAKTEYMEKNRTKFRNQNYALTAPDAAQRAYQRRKTRLSEAQKTELKEKARLRARKYREEHPEKVAERNRMNRLKQQKKTPTEKIMDLLEARSRNKKYRETHKEEISRRRQQFRAELKEKNPELLKEIDRRHNQSANRAKSCREYYLRHKEELAQKARENPKTQEYKRRYKIKKRLEKTGPQLAAILQGILQSKQI